MIRRRAVLLSLLCVGACAKGAPRDSVAPEAASAAGGDFATEDAYAAPAEERDLGYTSENPSFDELQARFEQLDADLSAQGISGAEEARMTTSVTSEPGLKATDKKTDATSRCERICSLKDAICEVSERICGLAETHEDDPKYAEACTRSEERCEHATTACSNCTQ